MSSLSFIGEGDEYLLCFDENTHFSTQHLVDVETVCTRSSGQLSSGLLHE